MKKIKALCAALSAGLALSGAAQGAVMQVTDGTHAVTVELNDSEAAKALYAMLPFEIEVEDYADNEKIFYPREKLPLGDTPHAKAAEGPGTLAYFAPWGDVVFFFGSFREHSGLYSLGRVTAGAEQVP